MMPPTNPQSVSRQQSVLDEVMQGITTGAPDPHASPDMADAHADSVHNSAFESHTDETPRGPDGKFVAKVDPANAVKAPEEVDGVPAPTAEGEEVAEAEAPKEPVKLATDFTLIGPDGDELDPGDVVAKIPHTKFTVGGKEYDLPYDRVVRLAKSGVHNEKLYADAQTAIESREVLESELTTHQEKIQRDTRIYSSVLNDLLEQGVLPHLAPNSPAAQLLQRWQHHNTPEARAERAERELQEFRQQQSGQSQAASSASFVQNDVLQPIQALLQQFPSVTQDEIIGRFTVLTQKYGATIQPKDFPAVRQIVRDTLPAYAASLHETRSKAETADRARRESNTLLKKRVAQNAKPIGRRASAEELKAKQPEPRTLKEKQSRIVDDALRGII